MNTIRIFGRLNGHNSLEYTEYTIGLHAISGEEWIEILNTKGNYYASNKGRIKMNIYPKDTSPTFDLMNPFLVNGRLAVRIIDQNEFIEKKYLDRLVLQCFCPRTDQDKLFVKHLDGDQSNCKLENLEWEL